MTGYQLQGAIRWLKQSKQHGKRTILGGIHVTMEPEQCLAEDYVDSVVLGPGERGIIEAIHGGPKQRVEVPITPEDYVSPVSMETLPYFRRSALTGDTILLTSRGCLYRCGFCFSQKFYLRSWHSVDMERWQRDVIFLKEHAGVTQLQHGDDWPGKWERIQGILQFLKDQGVVYHPCMRADQIDDQVAKELSRLGATQIGIGMESGSDRILRLIQKDITTLDQLNVAHALARYSVWPQYYWITGFPTETWEETLETLDMADYIADIHNGQLTQSIFAYHATPGSSLFGMVDQTKLPGSMEEWSHYSSNSTSDPIASALYHIGGLHFHKRKGDKTDRNFPGLARLLIAPFEASASWRWKHRNFGHYGLEKRAVEFLLEQAGRRVTKEKPL